MCGAVCVMQQSSHSNLKLLPAVLLAELLAELLPADSFASQRAMLHSTMMCRAAESQRSCLLLSSMLMKCRLC